MDTFTSQERSRIMSSVKAKGNKSTELKLLELFKLYKLKGWRRKYLINGNPDFVFPKRRLAVFVDGCFWHGCSKHCRMPKSNQKYWIAKISRNKKRDYKVTKELRGKNWDVIRLWEHELKNDQFKRKMNRIKKIVQQKNQLDQNSSLVVTDTYPALERSMP